VPNHRAPGAPRPAMLKTLLTWSGVVLALASFVFLTACPKSPDDTPQGEGDTVHSALPETVPLAGPMFASAPDPGGVCPAPPVIAGERSAPAVEPRRRIDRV
jgi:hypothetical protein